MLLSIIIPLHNLGQYLPECLNSVFLQDLDRREYEIVIVDDASTDDSYEVANNLRLANLKYDIKIIQLMENKYLAGALNSGISFAKGKYILALDADNKLGTIHTLTLLTEALEADRDLDIAYGSMDVIEESGKVWHTDTWPPKVYNHELQLTHKNQIMSSAMYRRTVWERVCGYRTRVRTAEDALFWTYATSLGFQPRKITESTTLVYRNRADSMSHINKEPAWEKQVPRRPLYAPSTRQPILVSVIIPVGPGHEKLVINAIDSIWAQTLEQNECIVVWDTDAKLPDLPPWITLAHSVGGSPAASRNYGMSLAQGQCIMFLDADDTLEPDALELMHKTWQANKGYVYTDWIRDNILHECPEHDCSTLGQALWHPSSIMLAREEAPEFDPYQTLEDWDYVLQCMQNQIYGTRVPFPLLNVRAGTSTRTFSEIDALNLKNKWAGGNIMACTSCGGRRAPKLTRNISAALNASRITQEPAIDLESKIRVHYKGQGTFPYRGPATGVMYYFSSAGHTDKDVFIGDVPKLMQRQELFERVS
jgi:glycosyltransferase involved in cell wall biosynthesis